MLSVVGDRASERVVAFLAEHPLPAKRDVPLAELGWSVVERSSNHTRMVPAEGWRGWLLGRKVEVVDTDVYYSLSIDGRDYGRYETAPTTIFVEWQYAIRGGELWAVVTGWARMAEALDQLLCFSPEEVVDCDRILPEGWASEWWPTCCCGGETGHPSKILFVSEVKDHLRTWLANHSERCLSCGEKITDEGWCNQCGGYPVALINAP